MLSSGTAITAATALAVSTMGAIYSKRSGSQTRKEMAKVSERVNQLSESIEDIRDKHKKVDRRTRRNEQSEGEFNRRLDRVEDSVDEIKEMMTVILEKLDMTEDTITAKEHKKPITKTRAKMPRRIEKKSYSDNEHEFNSDIESSVEERNAEAERVKKQQRLPAKINKRGSNFLNNEELSPDKLETML